MKFCKICEKFFSLDDFYNAKTSKDGKEPYCKSCHAKKMHEYYQKNKSKIRQQHQTYNELHKDENKDRRHAYAQSHKEEIKERMAQYYLKNKDRITERINDYRLANKAKLEEAALRYRESHKDQIAASGKRWRQSNPDKVVVKAARRRATKRNAPLNDFTAAEWTAMKNHYAHRCVYCGAKSKKLTQDHIIPLSKGGSHTLSNIVPACFRCDTKKFTNDVPCPVQPLLLIAQVDEQKT